MIRLLEDLKKLFGRRLSIARQQRGYTQKELGRLVGLDANSLARIERGEQGMRWSNLEKVITILEFPACFYFEDGEPTFPPPTPEQAVKVISDFIQKNSSKL